MWTFRRVFQSFRTSGAARQTLRPRDLEADLEASIAWRSEDSIVLQMAVESLFEATGTAMYSTRKKKIENGMKTITEDQDAIGHEVVVLEDMTVTIRLRTKTSMGVEAMDTEIASEDTAGIDMTTIVTDVREDESTLGCTFYELDLPADQRPDQAVHTTHSDIAATIS